MYRVQNLKNRNIRFQDVTIKAYSFHDFAMITDYITLSKLTNSGKARYFAIPNPAPVVNKEKETEVKNVTQKEEVVKAEPVVVENTTVEVVENITESNTYLDEISTIEKDNEDSNNVDAIDTVESTEPKTTKRYGRKNRRNQSNSDNEQ